MKREEAKKAIEIMQAYVDGATIKARSRYPNESNRPYKKDPNPDFNWGNMEYIIETKKKTKKSNIYTPFRSKEECMEELQKHSPFGVIRSIIGKEYYTITYIGNDSIRTNDGSYSFDTVFDWYTFYDRSPFGIKEK